MAQTKKIRYDTGARKKEMKEHYDVIIVGTGAAGLYCALNLPEKMKILLITKQKLISQILSGAGRNLHAAWRR